MDEYRFDASNLTQHSTIVNVPMPMSISGITSDTVIFDNYYPLPPAGWDSQYQIQLYNNQIDNNRYSIVSSTHGLATIAGGLIHDFVAHVSDHRKHIHKNNICALISDPSSWASMPDITVTLELINGTVSEVTENAVLKITATRFLSTTTKSVTIKWGDGGTDTFENTGNVFTKNHIYNLKASNRTVLHTIKVTVRDVDLNFRRSSQATIWVTPITKATQMSRARIASPTTATQTSRALIKSSVSKTQTTRAIIN